MKKLLCMLFIGFLFFSCSNSDPQEDIEIFCGIFEGNVALRTPGEITQFAKCNYTEITGNLSIFDGNGENPIMSLSALSSLQRIGGL